MVRTQIYLTQKERDALAALARATGRKQGKLIRQAVDPLIEQCDSRRRQAVPARVAGMWNNRDDLPDFRALRQEWNRR